jgi:hypothetical protein
LDILSVTVRQHVTGMSVLSNKEHLTKILKIWETQGLGISALEHAGHLKCTI